MKRKIVILFLVLFCILQFFPINRNNPPVEADLIANQEVKSILKKTCYDCHSNETRYPIYSYLFPVSIFLKYHIDEGREELNFSNWEKLSVSKKASKAIDIAKEIKKKEMPLLSYTIIHRNAKLSEQEILTIINWTNEMEKQNESRE